MASPATGPLVADSIAPCSSGPRSRTRPTLPSLSGDDYNVCGYRMVATQTAAPPRLRATYRTKGLHVKLAEMYETAIRMGIEADPARVARPSSARSPRAKRRFEALPDYLKRRLRPRGAHQPVRRHAHLRGRPRRRGHRAPRRHRHERRRGAARRPPAREGPPHRRDLHPPPRGHGASPSSTASWRCRPRSGSRGACRSTSASRVMDERRVEVRRRFMPMNVDQAIDAARLLDIPFFSAHTPTDNLVDDLPHPLLRRARAAARRGRAARAVRRARVPLARAAKGAGPYVVEEKAGKRAGKVWVDMTGGTEGPVPGHGEARRSRRGHHRRHAHEPRPAQGRRGAPHPRGHRRPHLERLGRHQPAASTSSSGAASRSCPPRASSACGATRSGSRSTS